MAVNSEQQKTSDLVKNLISPKLTQFEQNSNRDLSSATKPKEPPPWKVSTTQFKILTNSQQADLKKVNQQLEKISKQLQTVQDILNNTLGRLVTILKAIEDPLALLFELLAAEILKLEAAFGSNMGIFMLDDVSEQVKVKLTFGNTNLFDASAGLNIAGGFNNLYGKGLGVLSKYGLSDNPLARNHTPTVREALELQKVNLRFEEFLRTFDEYNADIQSIVERIITIYTKAQTGLNTAIAKNLVTYDLTKKHYAGSDKTTTGTNTDLKTFFDLPILSVAMKALGTTEDLSREDYLNKIVNTQILSKIYSVNNTNTTINTVINPPGLIRHPNGTTNTSDSESTDKIDYSYSTLSDQGYLLKVAAQADKSGSARTPALQENVFNDTQASTIQTNIEKGLFALVGSAVYKYTVVMADASKSTFEKRIATYEIIETYFRRRLDGVDANFKSASTMTKIPNYVAIDPSKTNLVNQYATLNSDSITQLISASTGILSVPELTNDDKINYRNFFLLPASQATGYGLTGGDYRIETKYGIDVDVQILGALASTLSESIGTTVGGRTESQERIVLSNIFLKIGALIGQGNQQEVWRENLRVISSSDTNVRRNVISTTNTRAQDETFSAVVPGTVRNQINIIENSIATQIDTINSYNNILKYKKEYYNKTLDSLLLSLQNKFGKLQEVFDNIKRRGNELTIASKPAIANAQLLNTRAVSYDEFILLSSFLIQIILSIKDTFQPFLINKINVLNSKAGIAKVKSDGQTDTTETLKKVIENEIDWNDKIIGTFTFSNSLKQDVESYLNDFKQLMAGTLPLPLLSLSTSSSYIPDTLLSIKNEGNTAFGTQNSTIIEINQINNKDYFNSSGGSGLGNIFNLYQETFETFETTDARNNRLKLWSHLDTLKTTDNTTQDKIGDVEITKYEKKLLEKQMFSRYYNEVNLNRLLLSNNIIEPKNFLRDKEILQKIRELKQLINDNIDSNKEEGLGIIDKFQQWLSSINDFLCSNDDSQKIALPPEIKSALTQTQTAIQLDLDHTKQARDQDVNTLKDKIKNIDFLNNSLKSGTSTSDKAQQAITEINILIGRVGGYKYYFDVNSKTIKITTVLVTGTSTEKINTLQSKLDALAGKTTTANLTLAASSDIQNSISKIDAQIALTKQKIAELEAQGKPTDDIKLNELNPLQDLRNKTAQGNIAGVTQVNFTTQALAKLEELNAAQRNLERISDDFLDVQSGVADPKNGATGITSFATTDIIGSSSIPTGTFISTNELNSFVQFIYDGDVKSFVKNVRGKDDADYYKKIENLKFIIGTDGNIDPNIFTEEVQDVVISGVISTPTKRKAIKDFVTNPSSQHTDWEYSDYAIYQDTDSKYPNYNGKVYTKNLFISDDTSILGTGSANSNIINGFINYLDFTLTQANNIKTIGKDQATITHLNEIKNSIIATFAKCSDVLIDTGITTGKFAIVDSTSKPISNGIFSKIDLSTNINYSNYKAYLKNDLVKILDGGTLMDVENAILVKNKESNISKAYGTSDYKDIKANLEVANPAFLLPLTLRTNQLDSVKTKFDEDLKKISQGAAPTETDDNRGFFQLMLRSKNEWITQIITAFTNEDDKRRPIFPDDMSSRNPLKIISQPSTTSASGIQIVTDKDVENIKKTLGDLTGGLTDALAKVDANSEMAVLIYLVTATDAVALFNKVRPIYDTFVSMRDGKESVIKQQFDQYTAKIEKTFYEIEDSVVALIDDIKSDAEFISEAFNKGPLDLAKSIAKGFISFDCSESARISRALKASTKLPPEVANGIINKWATIRLTDIPPFQQISKITLGLSGLLKGLARPKIGLAKTIERILNNLNKKINLLKKIVKGINLLIEFLSFIGNFQIDATTLELENVRSVTFVEQCLRNSEQFPLPFGVTSPDQKFFIASVFFVMPMQIYPFFKKLFNITDRKAPTPFVPPTAIASTASTTNTTTNPLLTSAGETSTITTTGGINTGGATVVV